MILDKIDSPKLAHRQRKLWGELRPGDRFRCPHDGETDTVTAYRPGYRGRQHVEVGRHTHVRPASDITPIGAWR